MEAHIYDIWGISTSDNKFAILERNSGTVFAKDKKCKMNTSHCIVV